MKNGWDPDAFDRWLTTEPTDYNPFEVSYDAQKIPIDTGWVHPDTCTCWRCQEDPFAGLPDTDIEFSGYFSHSNSEVPDAGKVVGFGACETEDYPKYGAEEFD